jgi:hypothetical protein
MSGLDTYREFLRRGFHFKVMKDRLDVKGTVEPLKPELINLLKEHKSAKSFRMGLTSFVTEP